MIRDYDRSHWFGASDSKFIFAESHLSRSWLEWWDVKCGKEQNKFHGNIFTKAGNTFEHSILKTYNPDIQFDRQIKIPNLRLRVNLDGNTYDEIYEVKTYQIDKSFSVTDGYYYQAQMQMLAWKIERWMNFVEAEGVPETKLKNPQLRRHIILAYGLYPDEYYSDYTTEQIEKGLIPIDKDRIKVFEIKPSRSVIRKARKNLSKLAKRLRKEEINAEER